MADTGYVECLLKTLAEARAYSLFMMVDLGAKRAIERYGRYAPEGQHPTLEEQGHS